MQDFYQEHYAQFLSAEEARKKILELIRQYVLEIETYLKKNKRLAYLEFSKLIDNFKEEVEEYINKA